MSRLFIFSRVNILKDFALVIIISAIPFLFFLYMLFPEGVTEWKTRFFHINMVDSGNDINAMFWYFSYKILTVLIFSLWFITCKHWWRYLILVPFLVEINKFTIALFEFNYMINYQTYYSFILSLPITIGLFIISKKLNYYSFSKSINKQIDEEINVLMKQISNYNKEDYRVFKTKLIELRKQKAKLDKKEYLIKLIKLREDYSLNHQNK